MDIGLPSQVNLKEVLRIKKYLYLPSLTVVVIVGLLAFFIGPTLGKVSNLRKEIALASGELTALETKVEVLQGLDESMLLEQVGVLEHVLPSKKDVFGLLTALNGLAAEEGVALGNFELRPGSIATETATPSASAKKSSEPTRKGPASRRRSDLESIAVSVSVIGSFEDVTAFFSSVERLRPLMRFTQVSLSPVKRRSVEPVATPSATFQVVANLGLDLFYASLPTQLGSASDPLSPLSEAEQLLYDELLGYLSYEVSLPSSIITGNENLFSPF
ncbi:hypothetical protein IH980_01860 [Patescibacteria group bacterium]|nr:hypothetical protein [Patescibacteria group bacterium]